MLRCWQGDDGRTKNSLCKAGALLLRASHWFQLGPLRCFSSNLVELAGLVSGMVDKSTFGYDRASLA